MDNNELRKLIEQLHDEIQNTKSLDNKGQELLSHLDADIRELLNRNEGKGVPNPSTIQRLEESLNRLEATHPDLAKLLFNILESLSNAGI
jgi:hypothetical protein